MKNVHKFLAVALIVLGILSIVSFAIMLPNNFIAGTPAFIKLSGFALIFIIYGALALYYQLKKYTSGIQRLFFGHALFIFLFLAIYSFNNYVVRTLALMFEYGGFN